MTHDSNLIYLVSLIAVITTLFAIFQTSAIYALLYLVLSFLSISLVIFHLGAPFAASLEVIIYAGAIVVLFVFVVMIVGERSVMLYPDNRLRGSAWLYLLLAIGILIELLIVFPAVFQSSGGVTSPEAVGTALFSTYPFGVELVSFLLLAGLLGAYRLGSKRGRKP